jgi:dihydroorotase
MDIIIRAARIIDSAGKTAPRQQDMLIRKGKIEQIAPNIPNPKKLKEITGNNLHVSLGWVDMCAYIGDPGLEHREDLQTAIRAAASGGFTTVLANPNTNPALHSKSEIEYVIRKSSGNVVNILPIGAISHDCKGVDLTEMHDMHAAGAVAFGDGFNSSLNAGLTLRSLQYVKPFGGLIITHPFEKSIAKSGQMNEGVNSTVLGMHGIPHLAEELMVKRDLDILDYTESRLHFAYVSTPESIEHIKKAKAQGKLVTCSVTPYNLALVDDLLLDYDTNYKLMPPLRTKADNQAMVKALKDGTIDTIASFHIPHDPESKDLEFDMADFGMISFETTFALVNTYLGKKVDLETIIEKLTIGPRDILGLEIPEIAEGMEADLTIFDPEEKWTFTAKDIKSRSKNTPFVGHEFMGRVVGVVNNGQVYLNEIAKP